MRPWQHAKLSAGEHGDWLADLAIHEFVDSTKVGYPQVRHRMILHNADLGPELAARAFPDRADARDVALGHIGQDFRTVPTLAEWLTRCDAEKFPKPVENANLDTLASDYARTQKLKTDEGPRAVLDLLLLPVTIAGPGAINVLFNAMGPAIVRRVIGPPRPVPGAEEDEVMFEPGHAAERMIHAMYGSIPSLYDVVGAIREMPQTIKEAP